MKKAISYLMLAMAMVAGSYVISTIDAKPVAQACESRGSCY